MVSLGNSSMTKCLAYQLFVLKYDDKGNKIETTYYDSSGQQVNDKMFGVAIVRNKYDDKGNQIETSFYGMDGQLNNSPRFGVAIIRSRYDENNKVYRTFINKEGKIIKQE